MINQISGLLHQQNADTLKYPKKSKINHQISLKNNFCFFEIYKHNPYICWSLYKVEEDSLLFTKYIIRKQKLIVSSSNQNSQLSASTREKKLLLTQEWSAPSFSA